MAHFPWPRECKALCLLYLSSAPYPSPSVMSVPFTLPPSPWDVVCVPGVEKEAQVSSILGTGEQQESIKCTGVNLQMHCRAPTIWEWRWVSWTHSRCAFGQKKRLTNFQKDWTRDPGYISLETKSAQQLGEDSREKWTGRGRAGERKKETYLQKVTPVFLLLPWNYICSFI